MIQTPTIADDQRTVERTNRPDHHRAASHTADRPRVLICAYMASPDRGSECSTGWNIPLRLAERFDVQVITATASEGQPYREEITRYFQRHGDHPHLRFHFIDPPKAARFLKSDSRLGRILYYAGYETWQRTALKLAMQLHHQRPFDLVHHLTITGYREPGYLWQMGVPFVWGPIGGAADMPWSYFSLLGWKDKLFVGFRSIANQNQRRGSARCRSAAEQARHIWTIGREDAAMIRKWGYSASMLPDTGVSPAGDARLRDYDGRRPLRLVWSGLHLARKALPLFIEAIARLPDPNLVQATILGQGPQTGMCKRLAEHLGIGHPITWTGQLSREHAITSVAHADLMVFTSLQEGAPNVINEALALGLPVICHDACGMSHVVTDDCGIKIPVMNPNRSSDLIAMAIESLRANPQRLQELSAGALRRANQLTWDEKVKQISMVYDRILADVQGSDAHR